MIRPIECAHHNYMIWEQTIDGYLRSHSWAKDPVCEVPLHITAETAEEFQTSYGALGWDVWLSAANEGTVQLHFRIPPNLVPRSQ